MLNIWDIILLIPLLLGAWRGFQKGIIQEVFSALALVVAIIGGFKLTHQGVDWLSTHTNFSDSYLPFLAFTGVFILTLLIVNLAGRLLKAILNLTPLGGLDSFIGAVLGITKWLFGLSIILWLISLTDIKLPSQLTTKSLLYPYYIAFAPALIELVTAWLPNLNNLIDTVADVLSEGRR